MAMLTLRRMHLPWRPRLRAPFWLVVLGTTAGCAPQLPPDAKPFAEVTPPPGYTVLYIYNKPWITTNRFWPGDAPRISIDGQFIATVPTNGYTYVFLHPGKHAVSRGGLSNLDKPAPAITIGPEPAYALAVTGSLLRDGSHLVITGVAALPIAAEPDYRISTYNMLFEFPQARSELVTYRLVPPVSPPIVE